VTGLPEMSTQWEPLVRLLVALLLGAAVGWEREMQRQPAGFRTHALVGLGSAIFTVVSAFAFPGPLSDPTRIAAQIVTGIGFLGAGAIIRQGLSVKGLTTAAGLWVVAAIGMAVGAGYYSAALIATGIVLVGLGPFRWLEGGAALARFRRAGGALEIDLTPEHPISDVLAVVDARPVRLTRVEFADDDAGRHLRLELDVPLGSAEERLVDDLAAIEGVRGVRWSE
jgi:putative Mg2+ transporter-C (MgtC) family protein